MSNNTSGPAFPVPMFSIGHAKYEAQQQGLSLRDYFAAKAMQGLIVGTSMWQHDEDDGGISACAYSIADAMLKAREVKP